MGPFEAAEDQAEAELVLTAIVVAGLHHMLERELGEVGVLVSGEARAHQPVHRYLARRAHPFGLYLLVIAWLAWRLGYVPKLLSVLIGIAGLGYIYDRIGQFVSGSS